MGDRGERRRDGRVADHPGGGRRERDIVELVRYNLNQAGYRVVSATDSRQAVEMARRVAPTSLCSI